MRTRKFLSCGPRTASKSRRQNFDFIMQSTLITGYLQEKAIEQVENFSKEELKHVDTEVKDQLPTCSGENSRNLRRKKMFEVTSKYLRQISITSNSTLKGACLI